MRRLLALLALLSMAGPTIAQTRTISFVAGGGASASDGVGASEVRMQFVQAVVLDAQGRIYFTDLGSNRVRRLDPEGRIVTVAGNGSDGYAGDGGQAVLASIDVPHDIALDGDGNLIIADSENNRIRRVDANTGIITTLAGNGIYGYGGDDLPATSTPLAEPSGVAVDKNGSVYIADTLNHRVRRVDRSSGTITTVAGNGTTENPVDGVRATNSSLNEPIDCFLRGEALYVVERAGNRLRKVDTFGIVSTVAGTGETGSGGDGGPATLARLNSPRDVVIDGAGDIFIADGLNHRIRHINAQSGIISTVAGNGIEGRTGTGGSAILARIALPTGLFLNEDGVLYLAEENNHIIRRLEPAADGEEDPGRADFDGDGVVDFSDFVLLASTFGSRQGDRVFDIRYDLDGSTVVDFSDFVTLAGLFGKSAH